jgi:hypothetical protein
MQSTQEKDFRLRDELADLSSDFDTVEFGKADVQ